MSHQSNSFLPSLADLSLADVQNALIGVPLVLVAAPICYGVRLYWSAKEYLSLKEEQNDYKIWPDVEDRIAIVTGVATGGLGFDTAKQLAEAGCKTVIITARDVKRGVEALRELQSETGPKLAGKFVLLQLDLASKAGIEKFVDEVKQKAAEIRGVDLEDARVDILIHNAGMICPDYRTNHHGHEMQMWTNHLAPFYLTKLMMHMMKNAPLDENATKMKTQPARIVMVSSLGGAGGKLGKTREFTVDSMNYASMKATSESAEKSAQQSKQEPYSQLAVYSETKAMNEFFCYALARKLNEKSEKRVTVTMCHPGSCMSSQLNRESDGLWGITARWIAPILSHTLEQAAACEVRAALDCELKNGDMVGPYNAYIGAPVCHDPKESERALNAIFKRGYEGPFAVGESPTKSEKGQVDSGSDENAAGQLCSPKVAEQLEKMWAVSEEMVGCKFNL